MNISEHFKKKPWTRRVNPDMMSRHPFFAEYTVRPGGTSKRAFIELTQDDFLNELSPAAHPINSVYMSRRPIYKPTGEKNEKGEEKWELAGYDELESVALGWQSFIVGKKIAHLATNGFWLSNETKDEEALEILKSWIDSIGIHDAFYEAVYYAERCGDSGIYLYQQGDNIEYTVYNYEDGGHVIYPQKDDEGNDIFYISYMLNGREACDVISTKGMETWVKVNADEKASVSFFDKMRSVFQPGNATRSEDGFELIRKNPAQIGNDIPQFVYFRVPDVSWGPGELSIESLENASSYVANEVKDSAFPVMFVKSEKIINLPPSEVNGKTLGVKGNAETLKNSDAKYLAPPDASNIADIHIKDLKDDIIRSTQTVIIEPEILKQGADSSTSIKILYEPQISWCKNRWIFYVRPVRTMMEIVKRLVGKREKDIQRYGDLRLSIGQDIWIPQNKTEELKQELDQVYARVKSRKAAIEDIGNTHIGDYETILKEWEEELEMKHKYSGANNGDENNSSATPVDNNAAGKSIQE